METLNKIVVSLKATIRDIVLAGVAAGAGFLIGKEIPATGPEVKALFVGAIYAAGRAVVAYVATLLAK